MPRLFQSCCRVSKPCRRVFSPCLGYRPSCRKFKFGIWWIRPGPGLIYRSLGDPSLTFRRPGRPVKITGSLTLPPDCHRDASINLSADTCSPPNHAPLCPTLPQCIEVRLLDTDATPKIEEYKKVIIEILLHLGSASHHCVSRASTT